MVQTNTDVPDVSPVTGVVGVLVVLMVALPEIRLHAPEPTVGAVAGG